jgi:hypothetical protein
MNRLIPNNVHPLRIERGTLPIGTKFELPYLPLIFFFCELLIQKTIFLVSQIPAQKTILAVYAIETIFTFNTVVHQKTELTPEASITMKTFIQEFSPLIREVYVTRVFCAIPAITQIKCVLAVKTIE